MKPWVGRAVALCALALLVGLGVATLHPRRPPWTWNALRVGALWVDVTPPGAGIPTQFPAALHPTPGDWDGFLASILDRWKPGQPVMVCCEPKHAAEAEVVARRLRDAGFGRVYILRNQRP